MRDAQDEPEFQGRFSIAVGSGARALGMGGAFLATGVNVLVVALSQGEVVGFASGTVLMHPDKRRGFFVNEVSVHEDLRRQGIGRRLMTRIMDVARDRACGDIWVATEGDNAPARALYRALGGAETTGIAMYDWPDEAG